MKRCTELEEKILSGDRNDPEVRMHTAECPQCAQLFADAEMFRLPAGDMAPPPALDACIRQAAAERLTRKQPMRFRREWFGYAAAAAVVLIAALSVVFSGIHNDVQPPAVASVTIPEEKTVRYSADTEMLYGSDLDQELLTLSMEIDRTDRYYTSISSVRNSLYDY